MLKRKTMAVPVVLGTALFLGLSPVGAAEAADTDAGALEALGSTDGIPSSTEGNAEDTGNAPAAAAPTGDTAETTETTESAAPRSAATAIIMRDGSPVAFDTLEAAVADARDGEEILVEGAFELSAPLTVSGGKSITLRATGATTVTRGDTYPQAGGKPQGLVRVTGRSGLALIGDSSVTSSYGIKVNGGSTWAGRRASPAPTASRSPAAPPSPSRAPSRSTPSTPRFRSP